MTWPAAAGIPNYTGSNTWGTSYNASNPIPQSFTVPNFSFDVLANSKSGGTGAWQKNEYVTVAAGATQNLLNYQAGDGYVSDLFITLADTSSDLTALRYSLVNVYYGGSSTASISVPLEYFFGVYGLTTGSSFAGRYTSAVYAASTESTYMSRIPIPFSGGIKIDLVNAGTTTMTLWSETHYHQGVTDNWPNTQALYVAYYPAATCTAAPAGSETNVVLANVASGKGRLAGISWFMNGVASLQEGNFTYYDNAAPSTPIFDSTGTEDFFETGFNWSGVTLPWLLADRTQGLYYSSSSTFPNGHLGAFRFHIDDPVTFTQGIKVNWQCGNVSEAGSAGDSATVAATVWYYTENLPSYTLSETISPVGAGSISGGGAGSYVSGTSFVLSASPNTGYSFSGWNGTGSASGCSGTGTCAFTISQATSVTASFAALPQYTLGLTSGNGTLSGSNCTAGSYYSGTAVSCTATPNSGYNFTGWTGTGSAASCSSGTCAFSLTANTTLTANYTANPPLSGACTGYKHYATLTVASSYYPASSVTNFHSLVAFNTTLGNGAVAPVIANLKSTTNSGEVYDGTKDIIFASSAFSGTQYSHEVLSWSATTGAFVADVLIPSVSSSSGATYAMCWGNASATNTQAPATVWSGYAAVNHLVGGALTDSTSNANTLTATGSPTASTGMFGGGYTLNGSTQYLANVSPTGMPTGSSTRTLSGWFNLSALTDCEGVVGQGANTTNNRIEVGICGVSDYVFADANNGAGGAVTAGWMPSAGSWHKLTWSLSGTNPSTSVLYLDGLPLTTAASGSTPYSTTGTYYTVGKGPGGTSYDYLSGVVAEPRIRTSAQTAADVKAEFQNESAPASFYTVGPEVTAP